jgi:hypothetical protein
MPILSSTATVLGAGAIHGTGIPLGHWSHLSASWFSSADVVKPGNDTDGVNS